MNAKKQCAIKKGEIGILVQIESTEAAKERLHYIQNFIYKHQQDTGRHWSRKIVLIIKLHLMSRNCLSLCKIYTIKYYNFFPLKNAKNAWTQPGRTENKSL